MKKNSQRFPYFLLIFIIVLVSFACSNSNQSNSDDGRSADYDSLTGVKPNDPFMDSIINDTMNNLINTWANLNVGLSVSYVVGSPSKDLPFKPQNQHKNSLFYGQLYYPATGDTLPPDKNTQWLIGSCTKTFTAYVLAMKSVQKKLHLDDSIAWFVDDYIQPLAKGNNSWVLDSLRKITYRKLASYNAGLSTATSIGTKTGDTTSVDSFFTGLAKPSAFKYNVGTDTSEYSNASIGLLAFVLTAHHYRPWIISNNSLPGAYASMIDSLIFIPFGMKHSSVLQNSGDTMQSAQSYYSNGNVANSRYMGSWPANTGAGAIMLSTEDFAEYLQSNVRIYGRGKKNKEALEKTRQIIPGLVNKWGNPEGVGLTWFVSPLDTATCPGIMWVNKGGGTVGYKSFISYALDTVRNQPVAGITITGNTQGLLPQNISKHLLMEYTTQRYLNKVAE